MPSDELKSMNFTMVVRNAPRIGPFSSDAWNDTTAELANDLALLAREWNTKLKIIIDQLPNGDDDTSVNVFRTGLDGKTLYIDSYVTSSSDDLVFYNTLRDRPYTVEEGLRNIYTYINDQIETVYDTVGSVTAGDGLTDEQKERIGSNIFNGLLVSSATSLDGKSERSRLNIIQIAKDFYGAGYSLDNDGNGNLANNSLMAMVDALLELHGGNWDDDIDLTHDIVTTDLLDLAGTRTMTGNLNMGTHAINNVTTLTASSTVTTGALSIAGDATFTNGTDRIISIASETGGGRKLTLKAGSAIASGWGGDLYLDGGAGGGAEPGDCGYLYLGSTSSIVYIGRDISDDPFVGVQFDGQLIGNLTFRSDSAHTISIDTPESGAGTNLSMQASAGAAGQVGGQLWLAGGAGGTGAVGGDVYIRGGAGSSTVGGDLHLGDNETYRVYIGKSGAGLNGTRIYLDGMVGSDFTFGDRGSTINLNVEDREDAGPGRALYITAGAAYQTSGDENGGALYVRGGVGHGTGTYGNVVLADLGGDILLGKSDHTTDTTIYGPLSLYEIELKTHSAFTGSQTIEKTVAIQTTDATETTLWSLTLGDETVGWVDLNIVARETDGSSRLVMKLYAMVYREGGTATLGDVLIQYQNPLVSNWTIELDTETNDIVLLVTGENDTTINWVGAIRYQMVSSNI